MFFDYHICFLFFCSQNNIYTYIYLEIINKQPQRVVLTAIYDKMREDIYIYIFQSLVIRL